MCAFRQGNPFSGPLTTVQSVVLWQGATLLYGAIYKHICPESYSKTGSYASSLKFSNVSVIVIGTHSFTSVTGGKKSILATERNNHPADGTFRFLFCRSYDMPKLTWPAGRQRFYTYHGGTALDCPLSGHRHPICEKTQFCIAFPHDWARRIADILRSHPSGRMRSCGSFFPRYHAGGTLAN